MLRKLIRLSKYTMIINLNPATMINNFVNCNTLIISKIILVNKDYYLSNSKFNLFLKKL